MLTGMEESELIAIVIDWVRHKTRVTDGRQLAIEADTDLLAQGLLDSLGFVELLEFVQDRTGREVDLSEADPAEFTTVRGFCRLALNQAGQQR